MKESKSAVLIRLPSALKNELVELAKREHRSLNQQIEFLLEQSLSATKQAAEKMKYQEKSREPR
jgi:hypothetical protein